MKCALLLGLVKNVLCAFRGAGMGKRKRSEALPRLIPAACAEMSAEASCLHAIKALEGVNSSQGCCAGRQA